MNYKTAPFHTLLSSLGKKTLRPGGLYATDKCLEFLELDSLGEDERLLEVACNKGVSTIRIARLHRHLHIDATDLGSLEVANARENIKAAGLNSRVHIYQDDITASTLKGPYAALLNEAMLTMLPYEIKHKALTSFFALVRPGGRIAIHDLLLMREDKEATKELTKLIRVNASPLTLAQYEALFAPFSDMIETIEFEVGGFTLLSLSGVVHDEGIVGALNIMKNLALRDKSLLKRVLKNRAFFNAHRDLFAHVVVKIRVKS